MGTLLSSGVPILTAMSIAKNLVENVVIEKAVENAQANIKEGQSIADPLKRSGVFPPLVIHMISVGERTGELPEMLKVVTGTFEEQVNFAVDRITSIIEPLMIIIMGIVILIIIMAVLSPLMDMNQMG
jgi:general secretion pathway protein F